MVADFSTDIPEVNRPEVDSTPEQDQKKVEQYLSDPSFLDYLEEKAKAKGENINKLLDPATDDQEIIEMAAEYNERVEPTIKKFKDFFRGEFFEKFKVVDSSKLTEASQKAETFLARLAVTEPDRFDVYMDQFEQYERDRAAIAELDIELRRKYRSKEMPELEAQKQFYDNQVAAGKKTADDNEENYQRQSEDIRKRRRSIFSAEGWNDRISSMNNFFSSFGRERRSDSQIGLDDRYEAARDELEAKIQAIRDQSTTITSEIKSKRDLLQNITNVRNELMKSLDEAGEMRDVLMQGLRDFVSKNKTDAKFANVAEGVGVAAATAYEQWDDTGQFSDQQMYNEHKNEVEALLKRVYTQVVEAQVSAVTTKVDQTKLAAFGKFIEDSVTSEEAQDIAKTVIEDKIKAERDITKRAHLGLMLRRLMAKTF